MVRNAVDHGIESPDLRRALGKSETGSLEIRLERRGHRVAVLVEDDRVSLEQVHDMAKQIDLSNLENPPTPLHPAVIQSYNFV